MGDSAGTLSAKLCRAVANASPGKVRPLLEKGADPNVRDTDGTPVFHLCISNARMGLVGSEDVMAFLDHGVDVDARDLENEETALHHAVRAAVSAEEQKLLTEPGGRSFPSSRGASSNDCSAPAPMRTRRASPERPRFTCGRRRAG